jgi:hypothetical protein
MGGRAVGGTFARLGACLMGGGIGAVLGVRPVARICRLGLLGSCRIWMLINIRKRSNSIVPTCMCSCFTSFVKYALK